MKLNTRKILRGAADMRTYPNLSKKPVNVGNHRIDGTIIGAARKNAAKILKALTKKQRRRVYLAK